MAAQRPLKIAVLATVTDFGGAERVVLSLIEHIDPDRFDLVPIIFTAPHVADNIFFVALRNREKKYFTIHVNKYKLKYLNPFVNIFEAYRILAKSGFDLVHTHGYRADVLGMIAASAAGLPVISTCHGYIANDLQLTLYNKLDRFILRFARKIIVVSEAIKKPLIESGVREANITLIQNAVNGSISDASLNQIRKAKRENIGLDKEDFAVGYVGRLSVEKGVRYLIEAFRELNESGIHGKLLIIGDGPEMPELVALVGKANLKSHVVFTGFQSNVDHWLAAMDVFVLPSLTEGTPMSLLEAMAKGVPVVASAVGGVPRVVESGKNGMLVPPAKSDEIAQAIRLLYEKKDIRSNLAREAKKTIQEKYDIRAWIHEIETLYRDVLKI